jgi:hypothetical protein
VALFDRRRLKLVADMALDVQMPKELAKGIF